MEKKKISKKMEDIMGEYGLKVKHKKFTGHKGFIGVVKNIMRGYGYTGEEVELGCGDLPDGWDFPEGKEEAIALCRKVEELIAMNREQEIRAFRELLRM